MVLFSIIWQECDDYKRRLFTPGVTRLTLRDLATMMVAVSDNSATNVLIGRVGMENVNAMLDSLGLHATRLRRQMMDLKAASEGRENVSTPQRTRESAEEAGNCLL